MPVEQCRELYEGSRVLTWPLPGMSRNQIIAGRQRNKVGYVFRAPTGLPRWVMTAVVRGSIRVTTGEMDRVFDSPSVVLIRPETPYALTSSDPAVGWSEYWTVFAARGHWLSLLEWPAVGNQSAIRMLIPQGKAGLRRLCATFDRVWRLSISDRPYHEDYALNALERLLLLCRDANPDAQKPAKDPRVLAALEFIHASLGERIGVSDIAKAVHTSASHLAHIFSDEVGESPKAYLERRRIERSCELLLASDDPIWRIAGQVGYINPLHFSTRFRRHTGQSPRAFRLKAMGQNQT